MAGRAGRVCRITLGGTLLHIVEASPAIYYIRLKELRRRRRMKCADAVQRPAGRRGGA